MIRHRDLTKAERSARLHYYRLFRSEGQTALQAWIGALRHLRFRATLRADVAAHAKRSRAAKKAWKTRRAELA